MGVGNNRIGMECTNMPPYAHALRKALNVPIYDIYSLITWFHAGIRPRRFSMIERD